MRLRGPQMYYKELPDGNVRYIIIGWSHRGPEIVRPQADFKKIKQAAKDYGLNVFEIPAHENFP